MARQNLRGKPVVQMDGAVLRQKTSQPTHHTDISEAGRGLAWEEIEF